MLAGHSFGLFYSSDFFACVLCIPFVDDIAERCELVIPLGTVHPVIYGDKVNVMVREDDLTNIDKSTKG